MEGMLNHPLALLLLCLTVAIAAAAGILLLLRTQVQEMKDRQAVIYRLGQFNRVDGPGQVVLNRSIETVERTIDIRTRPADYRISGLASHGVPFGYTLNFWSRTDLKAAAQGNQATLRKLAMFTDEERRSQVITLVRSAALLALRQQEQTHPAPQNATIGQQLLPVLPSTAESLELLGRVRAELDRTLPGVGVFLDSDHPLVIQSVHLDQGTLDSFGRGQRLALLREQLAGVPPDLLLQAFGAIEGLDQLAMKRYFIADTTGGAVEVQDLSAADGDLVRTRPGVAPPNTPGAARQETAAPVPPDAASPPQAAAEPGPAAINPDDWKVLRPPPRPQQRAG